jgi:branched-chain amino acid aminotransferase
MNGHAVESANLLTESAIRAAKALAREEPAIHDLDSSLLRITLTTTPRKVPEPNSIEVWDVKSCTDQYV